MSDKLIGILGIQGGFAKHQEAVTALGFKSIIVKTVKELHIVDKLIIPGGESTTMRLLLQKHALWHELQQFCQNKPVFGTCAGAILLAENILPDNTQTLSAIAITVKRNDYGRQINSFETSLAVNFADGKPQHHVAAMFIRAPKIVEVGSDVKVLAKFNNDPVLVLANKVMVATFHPELTQDTTICSYFLNEVN